VQRVGGDHRAGQVRVGQQRLEGGDLARGAVDLALGEDDAGGVVHRGQQVGLPAVCCAAGAAQGLAVDRDRPSPLLGLVGLVAVCKPRADRGGQRLRVHAAQGPAGAAHQHLQHPPARDPQRVGGHTGQLDPGVLQDLVQPLRLPGALLDLRPAIPGEVAQLPDRGGRHEAGPHQAVLDQLADPLGIGDVSLAAGHVAQMPGVQQPALHRILKDIERRLPVHPGRLHADQPHPLGDQPVPQRQQLHGHGPKRPHLLGPAPIRAGVRTQATTVSLWTSSPAQRSTTMSIAPPSRRPTAGAARRSLTSRNLRFVLAATVARSRGSRGPT
jgi:hypothetical protein